ncbi:hypothetical protein LY474_39925 [Myxococcus stipitatus]|uniref:hypothetical protein n=1 Tax=Myxococcus stipitatus TaxID=83455 RepID=UPI001F1F9F88|nr:hypothetical protein [Myxococcus stipitatus]MCE9673978.1 hypothetical protein [Myxococcus stipitatus]
MSGPATIKVSFIDVETSLPLGEATLPLETLPASFEVATTLELRGQAYEVVSATPMTAREFQATGSLRLELRAVKVAMVAPSDILYSLPTLADELPVIEKGSSKLERRVLELHEDDWRQVEFVALALQAPVEGELKAIARIHTEHRTGPGFDALHIRKNVPAPLEGVRLPLADLRDALGEAAWWLEGLSLRGGTGLVASGFALQVSSALALYGTERQGYVTTLGLQRTGASADLEGVARVLAALAEQHQLCLVDWCRVDRVPPSLQNLHDWLTGRG